MARQTVPKESPMDIVAGNIAGLMQRRKVSVDSLSKLLGYQDARPLTARMKDPSLFSGQDLNFICHFFDVSLEQLSHDAYKA